ncbi:uncharacterized protein LOC128236688 [Mya arenaria]|uniref:uncharacterized protein LOC128236688 n=1 Tax=Mya arenaria TaxID=6604 RepID=UPI0022E29FB6|nr:uncharacterized protein LOC128236688 [Mya arenaria]
METKDGNMLDYGYDVAENPCKPQFETYIQDSKQLGYESCQNQEQDECVKQPAEYCCDTTDQATKVATYIQEKCSRKEPASIHQSEKMKRPQNAHSSPVVQDRNAQAKSNRHKFAFFQWS